jgi:hypothetical protein
MCLFEPKGPDEETMSALLARLFRIVGGWVYVCLDRNYSLKETCVLKDMQIDYMNLLFGPLGVYINTVFLVPAALYTPLCFLYSKNKTSLTLWVFFSKVQREGHHVCCATNLTKICSMSSVPPRP